MLALQIPVGMTEENSLPDSLLIPLVPSGIIGADPGGGNAEDEPIYPKSLWVVLAEIYIWFFTGISLGK